MLARQPACYECLACLSDGRNPSDYPGHLLSCGRLLTGMRANSPPSRFLLVDVALRVWAAEHRRAMVGKASGERCRIRGGHSDSPLFSPCRNTIRAPCGDGGRGSPLRPARSSAANAAGASGLGAGDPDERSKNERRLSSTKKAFLGWEVGGGVGWSLSPLPLIGPSGFLGLA